MSRRRNRGLTAAARAGRVYVNHDHDEVGTTGTITAQSADPQTRVQADGQLLTWDPDVARATLDTCAQVWRAHGATLYRTHRDELLRDDLQGWLVVEAVKFGNRWTYDDHGDGRTLVKAWQAALYTTLTRTARWHFQQVVGRDPEAREAWNAGIDSTERLTDELGDSWMRRGHLLHGESLNVNPLTEILRREDLEKQLARAEDHLRANGRWTTRSEICLVTGCNRPVEGRNMCESHLKQERYKWNTRPCNIPECPNMHHGRGLCTTHYDQWQAGTLPEDHQQFVQPPRERVNTACTVPGCTKPARAKQMCNSHYNEQLRASRPPCSEPGCDKPINSRGLCSTHYARALAARKTEPCSVNGCEAKARTAGMCTKHYQRKRKHGSTELPERKPGD